MQDEENELIPRWNAISGGAKYSTGGLQECTFNFGSPEAQLTFCELAQPLRDYENSSATASMQLFYFPGTTYVLSGSATCYNCLFHGTGLWQKGI
jgi:hypothetical protein